MHVGTTRKADKGRALLAPSRTWQKKPAGVQKLFPSRVRFESDSSRLEVFGYRLAWGFIARMTSQNLSSVLNVSLQTDEPFQEFHVDIILPGKLHHPSPQLT